MPNLKTLYQAAANAAGTAIGAAGTDIEVFKIIIGLPVNAGNILLFDETNPGGASNTTGLVAKITLPTFSSTNVNPGLYVLDLTDGYGNGTLLRSGGSIIIDQTMQVTVLFAESAANA